jgi:hypothetical protein
MTFSRIVNGDFTPQVFRIEICERRRNHPSFQKLPSHVQQQRHHQRLQVRHFVFDSRKARKSKKKKNPFKVLKVPKESLYKDVKRKFLKIAMDNHPDMHTDGMSEKEQDAMRDRFIEARMAFERLEEDPTDGTAILKEELIDRESNFDSWFHNETGLKNPFDVDLDPETMKEVAEITEKMGGKQGMERDGGSKLTKHPCQASSAIVGIPQFEGLTSIVVILGIAILSFNLFPNLKSFVLIFFLLILSCVTKSSVWALARMVTSAVKTGGDAASILRLESGDVKQRPGAGPGGSLRRPRRR